MQERKKTEMSNKKNNYTVGTYNSGGESNKPNHTNSSRGGTSSSVLNGGPRQSVHVGAPILRLRVHSSDGKKFLVFFEQTMPYNELAAKIQERYMDVYGNTIEVESIKHIDDRGDEYDLPRTMGLQAAQILRDGELIKVDCQRRILHYNDSRKTPAMLSTPNLFSNNNNFTLNGATNTIMHPDISSIAIDTTNNFLAGTNTNTITSIPTPAPANKHRSSTTTNNNNKAKRPHEQEDKTVFYGEDSLRHQAKSQPLAKKPRMTGTTIPANSVTATSTTTRTTAPTVVANNNETNGDTSTILPGNTDSFIVSPIPNKTTDRTHNISLREELREALGKPDYSSSQDEDDDENEEEERHPKQATTSGEQEQEEEVESQQQQQQQQAQPMEEETATVHSNPSPAIAPTKAPTEIVDLSEVDDDAEETTMDNSEAVDDSKRMLDEEDDDDENQIFIIDGEDENGTTKEKKRIEEMKKIDNAAVLQPSTTNASQHSDIDSDIDSNTDSDSDTDDESDAKSDSDASSISTILDDEDEDKEEKEGEESNEDKDDESEATTAKIDKEGTSDNENDSENDEEAEDDDEDKGEKNKKKEQPKTSVKSSSTESDSDNDDSDSSDEEDEDEEEDEKEKAKPAPTIKATTTTTTTTKTVPPINNKPTAAAAIARPPMVTPVKVPQPTSTVKSTTTTTTGTNKATGIGFFLGAKGKTNTKSSAPASTTTTPNSAATTTAAITPASPKNPSEFEFHYAAKTKLLDMARKTNTFSGPATTLRRPGLGGVPGQSRTTTPSSSSSSSSSQSSTTTTPTTTSSTTTTT